MVKPKKGGKSQIQKYKVLCEMQNVSVCKDCDVSRKIAGTNTKIAMNLAKTIVNILIKQTIRPHY